MRIPFVSLFLLVVIASSAFSQKNPKIDANKIVSASGDVGKKFILEKLSEGEKFYRTGYYEGSFTAFKELYDITKQSAALNYKLGVSALLGGQSPRAADFLLESLPSVAADYYLLLGYAFQSQMDYSRARDAYEKYNNTLSNWHKKNFSTRYNQLLTECEFGERNAADSVPAFIINAGPAVNSYYDEYGAVEDSKSGRIFYTTRCPDRLPDVPFGRGEFDERVLVASFSDGDASEGIENSRLNSRFNSAVSGISPDEKFLFIYKGKKKGGQIGVTDISGKKIKRPDEISSRINHKIFQETTFTESNNGEVFFVSDRWGGQGGKDIWTAKRKRKNGFTRPKNMGSVINTPLDEEAVFVSPKGDVLYFASEGHPGFGGFDIFKSEKNQDGDWMTPENMGQPVNSPQDDLFFFPTSDSVVTLISSARPGGYGGLDIYKIQKDLRIPFTISGKITDAETGDAIYAKLSMVDTLKLEQVLSTVTDSLTGEYLIALEDTGRYMLQVNAEGYKMASAGIVSPTQRNAAVLKNFELEKLKHPYTLKGIITDKNTRYPVQAEIIFMPLDKDSVIHRIFSDPGSGEFSITFEDKFDLRMTVSAKDYYAYSDKLMFKNTLGTSEVKDIEMEKSVVAYTLSGKVIEEKTNKTVPAELAVFKPGEEEAFLVNYADSVTGNYSITIYDPGPFLVEVNADGYFFNNLPLQFDPDTTLKVKNITLQPMLKGARIVAEDILFTSGKAILRAESYPELNRLVRLLDENPSVRIEVSGHTDNTGSASLNKKLSKARALSVKRYLESQGIDPGRIEYEGYGFDHPIAPNTTAEGRAQNRRVEIKVIE